MDDDARKALFPPAHFVPTSIVWGFWAAGVMAGVNLLRLGFTKRGKTLILVGVVAQLLVWCAASFLEAGLTFSKPGMPLGPELAPGQQPRMFAGWTFVPLVILNGIVGYWLFTQQYALYREWGASHLRGNPYVAWWVSLLAVCGAVAVAVVILLYVG